MTKKLSTDEFAERLAVAADVGEKIDALASRVEEVARDASEIARKIKRSAEVERHTGNPEGKLLYSIPEAAEQLSMCAANLRRYIKLGLVPITLRRHGRSVRVHRRDIEKVANMDLPSVPQDKPWPEEREKARKQ